MRSTLGGTVTRLRSLAGRGRRLAEHECAARARRAPLDEHAVLFESFAGNGMLCNPEAVFRAVLAAPDLTHLRVVWALDGESAARAEFADDPRVTFVRRRSVAYYRELGRVRYLVNNATFPAPFAKRPGQLYLNTWHGTPLKAMGYDMPGGAVEGANVLRNFLAADYLLAPNEQTAAMYLQSYRLRDAFRGTLLRTGTPRIDHQFATAADRLGVLTRLRGDGVSVTDGARVVLYAPTWRGSFAAPDDDLDRLCADVAATRALLDPGTVLLVKVHQSVYATAVGDPRLRGVLVPNDVATNEVLAVTDVLVSDYSSITVDFLATGRPVVRYVPDLDGYVTGRGLTVGLEALPGPVCDTVEQLAAVLNSDLADEASTPAYARARADFCALEDGHAAERVVDAVFRGPDPTPSTGPRRTSVLIYLGGLRTNGITSSALSLLHELDHDELDVTVTFPAPRSAEARRHAALVDHRARVLPRLGRMSWTQLRETPLPLVGGRGTFDEDGMRHDDRLHDEWRRCFGDTRFDHVVDFGGYSAFFAKLLQGGPATSTSTWLHNDIRAEMVSPGRRSKLRADLRRITSMYPASDNLVSVSPELNEINRRGCGRYAPSGRFTYARNTVDVARIRRLAGSEPATADPATRTFVTVGRMSGEKNHERLLRAFATVHRSEPDTRLVVVGSGPLDVDLRALAADLGIAGVVRFTGSISNPYAVLAAADCFVLPSDYEGQPIVLLEALVLGLPIVSTDFPTVHGALPPGTGLVVRRDVEALAEGLRAFLRGAVPTPAFDAAAYNAEVVDEFYRAVGIASRAAR